MTYILRGFGGLGDTSKKESLKEAQAITAAQAAGADVSTARGQLAAQVAWDAQARALREVLLKAAEASVPAVLVTSSGYKSAGAFLQSDNPVAKTARSKVESQITKQLGPRPTVNVPDSPVAIGPGGDPTSGHIVLPSPITNGRLPSGAPIGGGGGSNTMLYVGGAVALGALLLFARSRG